jgi:L-rhamnose isomerase
VDLDGAGLSDEARENLRMQLPLARRPEFDVEVPDWVDTTIGSDGGGRFAAYESEGERSARCPSS